uniref:Uncharacterized protein n=1 Tax=Molossus molossus TaxID=27622 RepID=A0A7J8HBT8_MOLMO|nr:hypothetical protein HJG59_011109 [Molossus molossus]
MRGGSEKSTRQFPQKRLEEHQKKEEEAKLTGHLYVPDRAASAYPLSHLTLRKRGAHHLTFFAHHSPRLEHCHSVTWTLQLAPPVGNIFPPNRLSVPVVPGPGKCPLEEKNLKARSATLNTPAHRRRFGKTSSDYYCLKCTGWARLLRCMWQE